jgi:hypothetical protein
MMKLVVFFLAALLIAEPSLAQLRCNDGMGPLDAKAESRLGPTDFVREVAAREQVFAKALARHSFTMDVSIQTLQGEVVDGEFRQVTTFGFDDKGARRITVTEGPTNTLTRLKVSDRDIIAFGDPALFALTADKLGDRDIVYTGRQKMGELNTSVFDILPRTDISPLRAFQGRTWVREIDNAIVKICGLTGGFPIALMRFEEQRSEVGGANWFPLQLRTDEDAKIGDNSVHVRMTVKYSDYQPRPDSKPRP